MNLVFVEYRVFDASRQAFFQFIRHCSEREHMELYESPEQPGLYVEIWKNRTEEQFLQLQNERKNGIGEWAGMTPFLAGGLQRVKVWRFKSVNMEEDGLL